MNAALDGQSLFDGQELKIDSESARRGSIEKTVPGLDGVLSIDLGERGRKIRQSGILQAKSQLQMDEKISAISAYMDGNTHTLTTDSGEEFDDLRMDAFKLTKKRTGGSGLWCDYEIVYTQLVV